MWYLVAFIIGDALGFITCAILVSGQAEDIARRLMMEHELEELKRERK
jgi:hypothetical protein